MQKGEIDPVVFIQKFAAQFEALAAESVSMDTEFRQLPDWTSMQSLVVIASFDWEYGATLSAEELKTATTVGDLFALVHAKVTA